MGPSGTEFAILFSLSLEESPNHLAMIPKKRVLILLLPFLLLCCNKSDEMPEGIVDSWRTISFAWSDCENEINPGSLNIEDPCIISNCVKTCWDQLTQFKADGTMTYSSTTSYTPVCGGGNPTVQSHSVERIYEFLEDKIIICEINGSDCDTTNIVLSATHLSFTLTRANVNNCTYAIEALRE